MQVAIFRAQAKPELIDSLLAASTSPHQTVSSYGAGPHTAAFAFEGPKEFQEKSRTVSCEIPKQDEYLDFQSGVFYSSHPLPAESLGFLFPGQGSQSHEVLKRFQERTSFKKAWDGLLAYAAGKVPELDGILQADEPDGLLDQTQYAQPALAIADYSMLELVRSYGLEAGIVAGHSFGELVALAYGGCFSRETLIDMSLERGRLMSLANGQAPGKMLAVVEKGAGDWQQLHGRLKDLGLVEDEWLANINSPSQLVYSGPEAAIRRVKEKCAERRIKCTLLTASAAFHSSLMKPVSQEFQRFLQGLKTNISGPRRDVISNLPGLRYSNSDDVVKNLSMQMESRVNWVEVTRAMEQKGVKVFLEIGPKSVLSRMVKEILPGDGAFAFSIDGAYPLEVILAFLGAKGWDIKDGNGDHGTFDWDVSTPNAVIRGFLGKQKELFTKIQSIEDASAKDEIGRHIVADTDEVLTRFFGGVPSAGAKTPTGETSAPDAITRIVLEEVSHLTGFTESEIKIDARFDSYLCLDSITKIELLSALSNRLQAKVSDLSPFLNANTVRDLADVIRKCGAQVPASQDPSHGTGFAADARSTEAPGQGGEFSRLLQGELAARLGLGPDEDLPGRHFERDLKMNIFEKEDLIGSLIVRAPYLQMAERELLAAATIEDMLTIERLFDRRAAGRGGDEEVVRYGFKRTETDRPDPGVALPFADNILILRLGGDGGEDIAEYLGKRSPRSKIRIVKNADPQPIQEALSDLPQPAEIDVLLLIAPPGIMKDWEQGLEEAIRRSFLLSRVLDGMGRIFKSISIKILVHGARSPFARGLAGLCRSLAKEYPLKINIVDMDWRHKSPETLPWHLLWNRDDPKNERCLLRIEAGASYFSESLERAPRPTRGRSVKLPARPHILLVGGARGIAAETAKCLAEQKRARVSALGRTPMGQAMPFGECPTDPELEERLIAQIERAHHDESPEERAKMFDAERRTIKNQREIWKTKHAIEGRGGRFAYFQTDATQPGEFRRAVKEAEEREGPVHGVIHAAGLIRDGLIKNKSAEDFRDVVLVKVKSALNLYALFRRRRDLSFVCFLSSLSSWSGTPGQTDYCLANEIINVLAEKWNRNAGYPVASLLWSVWSETGLASDSLIDQMKMLKLGGISNRAGIRLFKEELFRHGLRAPKVLFTPDTTLHYSMDVRYG